MASINGVTLKSLKSFSGHEGEACYQANVYLNGRKLGFWSQDGRGAICDEYDFNTDSLTEAFLMWKSQCIDSPYYDVLSLESFMYVLVSLMDLEKNIKSMVKKGYPNVAYSFNYVDGYWSAKGYIIREAAENIKSNLENSVRKDSSCASCIKTDVYTDGSSNLDFVFGNKESLKREKKIKEDKEKELKKKQKEEEKARKKKEEKLNNNSRFIPFDSEKPAIKIIKDNKTGKCVEVPLYHYSCVMETLIDLFGNE